MGKKKAAPPPNTALTQLVGPPPLPPETPKEGKKVAPARKAPPKEGKPPKVKGESAPKGDSLFATIDSLFSKVVVTPPASPFMVHRYLASDKDLAQAAREIQRDCRNPEMTFAIWKCALPRSSRSPYFSYVGPAKRPSAGELEARLMTVHGYRREEAEDAVDLITRAGKFELACAEYGVDVGSAEDDIPF